MKYQSQMQQTKYLFIYFIPQLVNKFLFMAIAGSALNKLREMIDNPSQIPSFLAEALPSQSVFFICFIMLTTLTGYALQLLRIVPLILVAIKRKWLVKTAREDELAWRPPPVLYDRVVGISVRATTTYTAYSRRCLALQSIVMAIDWRTTIKI